MKTTILAVAVSVLTLAAWPFSGTSVEPTCSLQVARSGVVETPLSVSDSGVLEVKEILSAIIRHVSHEDLLTEIESALLARFGGGSVATQTLAPEYYWDYDPDTDTWTFICTQHSLLLVNDGGESPVVARMDFRVPYGDPE